MHTLQLQLNDDLYENLSSHNIDIQTKVKDFLYSLVDDGYPAISTDEAKKLVSAGVDRYRNGTGTYSPFDSNFQQEMNSYIKSL